MTETHVAANGEGGSLNPFYIIMCLSYFGEPAQMIVKNPVIHCLIQLPLNRFSSPQLHDPPEF